MMVRVYVLFGNGGEAAPFGDCDFVAFQICPLNLYRILQQAVHEKSIAWIYRIM